MTKTQNTKPYDLEDRTLKFSKKVLDFSRKVKKTLENIEILKQLVRAACSIGANYIEANESLSKKDFLMRVKISRKEAKEARYWLQLVATDGILDEDRDRLFQECTELMKIFGSIIEKSK